MIFNSSLAQYAREQQSYWNVQRGHYEAILRQTGALRRSDWWYYEYTKAPYLTLASDQYLTQRWLDQFHNNCRLTGDGGIAPREDFADDGNLFGPLFAHLYIEFRSRGGVPPHVISEGNSQLMKYFENGTPTGVRLFTGRPERLDNVIVKFGKREHLEAMYTEGDVRITPAKYYSKPSLLKAQQDLETERIFHTPAFDSILAGQTHATAQDGKRYKIEDGFLKESISCPDYALWSACLDIDRRMPDDFGADAALIIHNKNKFCQAFDEKVKELWPGVKTSYGPVQYYDPCSFIERRTKPVRLKHFSFAYQREWRFCAFPIKGKCRKSHSC